MVKKEDRKKLLINRIFEMFVQSTLLSTVVCLMCISGVMPVGSNQRNVTLCMLPILYIVWNIKTLRKCFILISNDKFYYLINVCATLIFSTVITISYIVANITFLNMPLTKVYSWFFLTTYLFEFYNFGIHTNISVIVFNAILFLSIFLAPIGLGWIKMRIKEEEELRERAPGILEVNPLEQKRNSTEVQTNEIQKTKEKDSLS